MNSCLPQAALVHQVATSQQLGVAWRTQPFAACPSTGVCLWICMQALSSPKAHADARKLRDEESSRAARGDPPLEMWQLLGW